MMEDACKVSLEYGLTLDAGSVVNTNVGGDGVVYVPAQRQFPSAVGRKFSTLQLNDTIQIRLAPKEVYEALDSAAFRSVTVDCVPEEARKPGTVLDFNHELSGQALTFDLRITGVAPVERN